MQSPPKRPKVVSATNEEEAPTPTICVLGATGVGKGSTLNSCFRSQHFSTSSRFASDTTQPSSLVLPWRGGDSGHVRGVDLCGFSDSEGRDTAQIQAMVAYLRREVETVHVFLLLLNSQEARVGVHLKDMLVAFKAVFGASFTRNVMVGFTRWDYTKKGAILRRGVTKEALSRNVNGLLRELLGHAHDVECVFLDNTVGLFAADELSELHGPELPSVTQAFHETLEAIHRALLGNVPFSCVDLEGTLAERDVGRDRVARELAAVAEGREACGAFQLKWLGVPSSNGERSIEEPKVLEAELKKDAQAARETLALSLASKTKPDLAHVMASVLGSFDSEVQAHAESSLFKNKGAAASFNRSLCMRLQRDYEAGAALLLHGGLQDSGGSQEAEAAGDPSSSSKAASSRRLRRFEALRGQFRDLVVEFAAGCRGGGLAWQPFLKLQEKVLMEQARAREIILRADLVAGNQLPEMSVGFKDAKKVAALFGAKSLPVPEWLLGSLK